MKKLLVLLALCMVFTLVLVACEKDPGTEETTTTGATTEAPTTGATTEAPTTEAPTTEAPTTEAPTTEPGTETSTEEVTTEPTTETDPVPTETEPVTTEPVTTEPVTTEPVTTEPVTDPPVDPPVDPVYTHVSFDECDMWIGETNVGNFFAPGASTNWDKIANVEDYNVEFIRIWGWVGFYNETVGEFGYQIDDNDPVYDAAFTWETGDDVKNAAAAGGAKSASRFQVMVPVRELSGEHTIKFLIKDAVGTVKTYVEFTMNKAVDPNAPVAFIPAADMAASIPGSPGINGAVMSDNGTYITIDTVNQGDPYYQLPMLNGKGTVASFVAIKYRSTSTFVRSEAFVGSGAGPSGAGDNITFDLTCDGKWHLAIVDLSQASAVVDNVINYLRWDPFAGAADATIDMAYIALFNSAEAAQIYDAKFADTYVDSLNVPQDVWGVTGHKTGIVPSEGDDLSGMIAAGGVGSGALLHQGYIALGELDLAQFSKVVIYYGVDGSQVTIDLHNASANNRIMLTSADQAMTNSPTEDVILAGSTYTELGWEVHAIEIDLTGVDYNGPVFVTYDTLPGTFMLISSVEFYYDNTPVEEEPEDTEPEETQPEETQPEEPVEEGFVISSSNTVGTLYVTGAVADGIFAASTDAAEAAVFFKEDAGEGLYVLYFMADDVKTYIIMDDKAKGGNLTTDAAAATVFEWNATYNTHEVAADDNARAFGCDPASDKLELRCYALSNGDRYNWGQSINVSDLGTPEEPATEPLVVDLNSVTVTGSYPTVWPGNGLATTPALGASDPMFVMHYGSINLGEMDLSKYSKITVTYGTMAGADPANNIDYDAEYAATQQRIMLLNTASAIQEGTAFEFLPTEDAIITSAHYEKSDAPLVLRTVEIDLTEVDYNGQTYLTFDFRNANNEFGAIAYLIVVTGIVFE